MRNLSMVNGSMITTIQPYGYSSDLNAMKELLQEPHVILDTEEFINWLKTTAWSARLEVDLQSIANDEYDRPLLHTWIEWSEFEKLVANASGTKFSIELSKTLENWKALRPDEAVFSFYLDLAKELVS